MADFLREELGVAKSGVKWDVGKFKLWQSTRPDIILFVTKQPTLALNPEDKRYQAAVSQFRQQREGTYQITGGSAIFTITSAIQLDAQAFEEVKEQWRTEMAGVGPLPPANPKFIALNVRKGKAEVLVNPQSGTPNAAHNDKDVGTPGGTNSFLVELTPLGAQEWVQGIKEGKNIPAGVKFAYEYLRMMPDVGAVVRVHGNRVFTHLSTALDVSYNGFFYGGSAQIDAAWDKMVSNGDVEVEFIGIGLLPPDLEEIRTDLVTTFADQAKELLFNNIFAPMPEVAPAEAGEAGGLFGGANFALKWRKQSEAISLEQTVRFKGWTWLKASMDANVTTLFSQLDASYVNEVNTEMSFPASLVVDADPMLADVAVSWSASEGKAPEAPVFGPTGGTEQYVVTSTNPDDVEIRYNAKVNFEPARWPVIQTSGDATVAEGGNQVVLKPAAWIGRHMIYMFVRDGDEIKFTDIENDYLIVNVSYEGPHLTAPIKDSARITPFEPVEFSYPLDPEGRRGQAKFSAFGPIGGRLVRAPEQDINFDEDAVFILASRDEIRLVSQNAVIPETDRLAQDLLAAGARPVVAEPGAPPAVEAVRKAAPEEQRAESEISGTVVGVEYGFKGPALIVETDDNLQRRVRLRSLQEADVFDEGRKRVRVALDPSGEYAERIVVELY